MTRLAICLALLLAMADAPVARAAEPPPPRWTANDFQGLLRTLGYAGYGWLRPESVLRQLARMARHWQGP